MEHFNEMWSHQSHVDLPRLLTQCSPAMASNMATLLYAPSIGLIYNASGSTPLIFTYISVETDLHGVFTSRMPRYPTGIFLQTHTVA
eukprot:COSAG05_NODE_1663_length_4312_cov_16.465243_2_plen_87_part_00